MKRLFFFLSYQSYMLLLFTRLVVLKAMRMVVSLFTRTRPERVLRTQPHQRTGRTYWIHADAYGDVIAVQGIITHLADTEPEATILLTSDEYRAVKKLLPTVNIIPLNYCSLATAFTLLRNIRPNVLIFSSSTLHTNLIMLAALFGARVIGLNTNLLASQIGTLDNAPVMRWYYAHIYRYFDAIYTNIPALLCSLGAPEKKVSYVPSTKIKNALIKQKASPPMATRSSYKIVLLVGSLHPDELASYLALYRALHPLHDIHLMLVPRRLDWQDALITRVSAVTTDFIHITATTPGTLDANISDAIATYSVSLICQMGVLFALHAYADIFYLGHTFTTAGGSNVAEPASWRLPIVTGPYLSTYANPEAITLEQQHSLIRTRTSKELIAITTRLITHPKARTALGAKNHAWLTEQALHADQKYAQLLTRIQS